MRTENFTQIESLVGLLINSEPASLKSPQEALQNGRQDCSEIFRLQEPPALLSHPRDS